MVPDSEPCATLAPESTRFGSVAGTRFARVEWFKEIGSTNTELLARARAGEPEGTVLVADIQTAGRGRRGRSWTAPPGTSLMMSVLLRPPSEALPSSRAALVTLAWALAAADACEQASGVRPLLKWPNDLVVRNSADLKLAGILAEAVTSGTRLDALVIGMGLNTGWPEVPTELQGIATSLNLESGTWIDRVLLARELLSGFEHRYAQLCSKGDADRELLAEARANSATLRRRVRVTTDAATQGEGELVGLAHDLDADGRLLVTDDSGVNHVVSVGDVVHLRPA